MKYIFTALLVVSLSFSAKAQCALPFGDFETWDDQTALFNADFGKDFPAETFVTPTQTSSLFRLFLLFFGFDLDTLLDNLPQDRLNTEINGFDRSDDSYAGDYSLKIGGDSLLGFTDLFYVAPCTENAKPVNLTFWYKHIGSQADSLNIIAALGESANDIFDAQSLDVMGAAAIDSIFISEEVGEWSLHQIPVQTMNEALGLDSIVLTIIRSAVPDVGNYWLIDEMQWDFESSTSSPDGKIVFRLGQSMDASTIFPYLDQKYYNFQHYSIFDITGKPIVLEQKEWKDAIDVSHLPSGQYVYQITTEEGQYSKLFVRY